MIAAQPLLVAQLSLGGACAVLQLNRGSAYRWTNSGLAPLRGRRVVEDPALLAAVEEVVVAYPAYGRPRVTMELRRRQWVVNPKRVQRLLREGGWLRTYRRRQVRTTDSQHEYPRFPNLLVNQGWRALTGPDQAWGADLTYIRLGDGFCFCTLLIL